MKVFTKPVNTKGWRNLMLALADADPHKLSSDLLVGLSALFFRLAAEAIGMEK